MSGGENCSPDLEGFVPRQRRKVVKRMETSGAQNEIRLARERIDIAISEQDWIDAWRNVLEIARSREDPKAAVQAIRELRETRYGLLTDKLDGDSGEPEIKYFEIVNPDARPISDRGGEPPQESPPRRPKTNSQRKKSVSADAGRHTGRQDES